MEESPTLESYLSEVPEVLRAYALIGAISSQWSHIELAVDVTIWRLGCKNHLLGACITSQIQSLEYKAKALAALVGLEFGENELFKAVNKFAASAGKVRRARNEAIHQAIGEEDGRATGIVITADRRLIYNLAAEKLTALATVEAKLAPLLQEYQELDRSIRAAEEASTH